MGFNSAFKGLNDKLALSPFNSSVLTTSFSQTGIR